MIRVLVAEDSAVAREYLVYLLSQDPALEVIGVARDGYEAVQQAERLRPDVIVMDVHMPRMDGYEATRQIMERVPAPIVIVSASSSRQDVANTLDALKAGALTVLDKPAGLDHPAHEESARRLVETVKLMAEVKVVRRWPRRDRPEWPVPAAGGGQKIQIVAMAASTGGPPGVGGGLRRPLGGPAGPPLLGLNKPEGVLGVWVEKLMVFPPGRSGGSEWPARCPPERARRPPLQGGWPPLACRRSRYSVRPGRW